MFGLLLVRLSPDPEIEAEFNDWYDLEHVPERLSIPGFLGGRRFVGGGELPYATLYELQSPDVLASPEYRVYFDGTRRTPWTRRIGRRWRKVDRRAYRQIMPGTARAHPTHEHLVLTLLDVNADDQVALAQRVARHAEALGERATALVFAGVPSTDGHGARLSGRPIEASSDVLIVHTASDLAALAHCATHGEGGAVEVKRAYVRTSDLV